MIRYGCRNLTTVEEVSKFKHLFLNQLGLGCTVLHIGFIGFSGNIWHAWNIICFQWFVFFRSVLFIDWLKFRPITVLHVCNFSLNNRITQSTQTRNCSSFTCARPPAWLDSHFLPISVNTPTPFNITVIYYRQCSYLFININNKYCLSVN